jgi:hypothetical protein
MYGLDNRGVEFEFQQGQKFSLLHIVQTDSGVHPASYPMGTGGILPQEVKQPGREADHSPPVSAKVKKMCIYRSSPSHAFMV